MEDIEDAIFPEKTMSFTKELIQHTFKNERDFTRKYVELRKKYRLSPNKPLLRKIYHNLIVNNEIKPNHSFLQYSLKRKCRSQSGVTVITILTSPTPEYTNEKGERVQQSFSCGKNCAYCPNEPEIKLTLKVIDINEKGKQIKVYTNDDIHLIRVLTYIIKNDDQYIVEGCSHFKDNNFIITFENDIYDIFTTDDIIVGVKVEQPRSYLSTEPAVLRANRNKFNPVLQVYDRTDALENCGHKVDKMEVLVLGGTWDHYPIEYQNEFIRDIYYAVNTLDERCSRERLSLNDEIKINETSQKRLIGLTLETRPDCINKRQIKKMRNYNVTRLQIGVQHIDDDILERIERGCTTNDTIKGNYLWKQNGGKVDWHLMPDLPGSSVEKDIEMIRKIFGVHSFERVTNNYHIYQLKYPELQADQFKIYPCSVVDWTKIKEWYDNGEYKPYSEDEDELIKVIVFIKQNIFPWIRLNRIVRDIPNQNILGGNENVNLRQKILARDDVNCQCIRCREAKDNKNISNAEIFIREYNGVNSKEYFISYESPDNKILYGFLRLRINHSNDDVIYEELKDSSFVRELHVYGSVVRHNEMGKEVQHQGIGKKLLKTAEEITINNNIYKVAIIAGVGVREYYRKQGYHLVKNYMMKELHKFNDNFIFEYTIIFTIIIILVSIFYDLFY